MEGRPIHRIPPIVKLDPVALRAEAAKFARRASKLLREAHLIEASHEPIPGICVECAEPFTISELEAAHYVAQGWELRKRCVGCQREKRQRRREDLLREQQWRKAQKKDN